MEPTQEMVKGFFSVPIPIECEIVPKSEKHVKVMRDEFLNAKEEGINF
jgi:hypothetical protein